MKHDVLRSIAHNVADSLASGCGLMIGVYDMNVFGEAGRCPDGVLELDILDGTVTLGNASPSLKKAVRLYAEALPDLCERQGASVSAFRKLSVRFEAKKSSVEVTVEDAAGRLSVDRYKGSPLRRIKGRSRSKRELHRAPDSKS